MSPKLQREDESVTNVVFENKTGTLESKVVFSTTRADLVKARQVKRMFDQVHQPPSRRHHPSSSVPRHYPYCTSFTFLRTRAAVQAVLREAGRFTWGRHAIAVKAVEGKPSLSRFHLLEQGLDN